jgi:hypothetical protein
MVSNHPQLAGGSHLPDITVITPVFDRGQIVFFVASRGHHADIGGISPGSMPPASKLLVEEGAAIVSYKLVRDHVFQVSAGGVVRCRCALKLQKKVLAPNMPLSFPYRCTAAPDMPHAKASMQDALHQSAWNPGHNTTHTSAITPNPLHHRSKVSQTSSCPLHAWQTPSPAAAAPVTLVTT